MLQNKFRVGSLNILVFILFTHSKMDLLNKEHLLQYCNVSNLNSLNSWISQVKSVSV